MNSHLRNEILKNLPDRELSLVLEKLELVELARGAALYEPFDTIDYLYFPEDCLISLISVTRDGLTVEAGAVGCEGLLGVAAIFAADTLPYRATVQTGGAAYKVQVKTVKKLISDTPALQSQLLSYFHATQTQVAQSAICNKFHTVQERVAKWLLLSVYRTSNKTLDFTHEFLSMVLGSGRATISRTLNSLDSLGLIRTKRESVTVVQPKQLQSIACECYEIISAELPECS